MRIDDELIHEVLRTEPAWQPPVGFAQRTAVRGVELPQADLPAPRFWSWINVSDAIPVAVITAIGIYFAGELLSSVGSLAALASAPTPVVQWAWVAVAAVVAGWFTLMPHAAD